MNRTGTLLLIVSTTSLLLFAFGVHRYFDKALLYEYIVEVVLFGNLAAYLIPALALSRYRKTNQFWGGLIGMMIPFMISIVAYVCVVCVFNRLTVPNFPEDFTLFQFILYVFLMQFGFAVASTLIVSIVWKVFF